MLIFLISTIIEFYTIMLILRIWIQWTNCDFYNPLSRWVIKVTQPIIGPLHYVIPIMGVFDVASLLMAFIFSITKVLVLFRIFDFQLIVWVLAILILLKTICLLIFWIMLITTIISWLGHGNSSAEHILIQLTKSLLHPIRNFFLSIGNIDLSLTITFLLFFIINKEIGELLQSVSNMLPQKI